MPGDLFLLDTDILSYIGRQRPPPGLREWLIALGAERLAISFPSIAELRRGAHLLEHMHPEKAVAISHWVDELLRTDLLLLPMTPEVAAVYAKMTSTRCLRPLWTVESGAKHNRLGHDLMVASVAIAHGAAIMTANTRDYLRVHDLFPLPGVYDPLRQKWCVRPPHDMRLPLWEVGEPLFEATLPRISRNDQALSP